MLGLRAEKPCFKFGAAQALDGQDRILGSQMLINVARQVLNRYPFLTPRASVLKMLPATPSDYGPFDILDGLKIRAYPAHSHDHVVKSLFSMGSFDPWVCTTLKSLVVTRDDRS